MNKKIYFISGHLDVTQKEFDDNYLNQIILTQLINSDCNFVVGDDRGVDSMAQKLLSKLLDETNYNRVLH